MGEVAELVLDGTLCQICGAIVYEGNPNMASDDDISPGYPRSCVDCKDCEDYE